MRNRVDSLDYMRGLMALSVMIYHYASWAHIDVGVEHLLGRLGIYAVSIFFVLSGLSLTIVYNNRVSGLADVVSFFIKRAFRILPLFWLSIVAFVCFRAVSCFLSGEAFDISLGRIFLNVTLLFSLFDHAGYLSTGAWSIGNEVVFYFIFPLVFLLANRMSYVVPIVFAFSCVVAVLFCFVLLSEKLLLGADQWATYVNPLNQMFLFFGGVLIGKYGGKIDQYISVTSIYWGVGAGSILIFSFYPAEGDSSAIVTGWTRLVLSMACLLFILSLYKLNPQFKSYPARVLGFFGRGCYSIYLLHPIVAFPLVYIGGSFNVPLFISYSIAFILTLIVSWVTFRYLEEPMMGYGKRVSHHLLCVRPASA